MGVRGTWAQPKKGRLRVQYYRILSVLGRYNREDPVRSSKNKGCGRMDGDVNGMGQRGPGRACVFETSEFRVGLQGVQTAVGGRDPAPVVAIDGCAAEAAVGHDKVPYANGMPTLNLGRAWLWLLEDGFGCMPGRCRSVDRSPRSIT